MSRRPPRKSNNRTWIIAGVVAVVLAVAVVVAVAAGGSDDDGGGGGGTGNAVQTAPVSVTGVALPQYPANGAADKAIGATIPTLAGKSLFDGTDMTIAPTGKPQIVVFLAHWCPHCQAEVPVIVDVADDGGFDGIDVRGISTGTRPDAANYPPSTWLEDEDWPFPTMADSSNFTAAAAYGLGSYPFLVFTDASGKVVARSIGEVSGADLTAAAKALKAGKPVDIGTGSSSSAG